MIGFLRNNQIPRGANAPATPARCLTCGGNNTQLRYARLHYRKKPDERAWDMHGCAECGLLFVWPLPSDADIASVYADTDYRADDLVDHTNMPCELEHFVLGMFDEYDIRPPGRLLDVGCGAGHFLRLAQARGWTPLGQEIALHSVEFARQTYGIEIITDPVCVMVDRLEPQSVDVLSLIGVIEHVPYPVEFLRSLRRLIKPAGALFIVTDNVASWMHFVLRRDFPFIMPPEHLQLFTPASSDALLMNAGFTRVGLRTKETILPEAAARGFTLLIGGERNVPPGTLPAARLATKLALPLQRWLWSMRLGAQLYVLARPSAEPL